MPHTHEHLPRALVISLSLHRFFVRYYIFFSFPILPRNGNIMTMCFFLPGAAATSKRKRELNGGDVNSRWCRFEIEPIHSGRDPGCRHGNDCFKKRKKNGRSLKKLRVSLNERAVHRPVAMSVKSCRLTVLLFLCFFFVAIVFPAATLMRDVKLGGEWLRRH